MVKAFLSRFKERMMSNKRTKRKTYTFANSAHSFLFGKTGENKREEDHFIGLEEFLSLTSKATFKNRRFDYVDLSLDRRHLVRGESDKLSVSAVASLLEKYKLKARTIFPDFEVGPCGSFRLDYIKSFIDAVEFRQELVNRGVCDADNGYLALEFGISDRYYQEQPEEILNQVLSTFQACFAIAESFSFKVSFMPIVYSKNLVNLDFVQMICKHVGKGLEVQIEPSLLLQDYLAQNGDTSAPGKVGIRPKETLLPKFWEKILKELEGYVDEVYVSQTNGALVSDRDDDVWMENCLPYDQARVIDWNLIAPGLLIPQGRSTSITNLTWISREIPNTDLRNPETWNDVLKQMLEIEHAVNAALKSGEY